MLQTLPYMSPGKGSLAEKAFNCVVLEALK